MCNHNQKMEQPDHPCIPIQLASDIHLEFPGVKEKVGSELIIQKAPVLALLGDIGNPILPLYEEFLLEQADRFQLVLIVAGNHEYYGGEVSDTKEKIRKICAKRNNLIFLDQNTYDFTCSKGHRVKFVGGTMWTMVPKEQRMIVSKSMNDYRCINKDGKKLTLEDTLTEHRMFVSYLKEVIQQAEEKEETLCLLTHHAPYLDGTVLEDETEIATAMGTDLSHLISGSSNVTFCGFGHTHRNALIRLDNSKAHGGKTIVASNQLGYAARDEDTCIPYSNEKIFYIPCLK